MGRLTAALGPPGAGRTLALVYAIFALAAGSRSLVQILTRFEEAPLPYLLSAAAALIYVAAAATIGRDEPARLRVAAVACSLELAGVLAVGIYGLSEPGALAAGTVWGGFGADYGYLPLFLPVLGLMRVGRHSPKARTAHSP